MIHLQIRRVILLQIFGPYLLIAKVILSYQEPDLGSRAPILAHFYRYLSTYSTAHQISLIVLNIVSYF